MKIIKLIITLVFISGFISCYDGVIDTYDDSIAYNLRDRGPAGGWIFYINPNYKKDGWRYLEAATEDMNGGSSVTWSSNTSNYANGISALPGDIGKGKSNTDAIILQNNGGQSAAKVCRDYRGGGYSDWFLPSTNELDMMCWNLRGYRNSAINPEVPDVSGGGVGAFQDIGQYWSSTEDPANSAQACDYFFGDGHQSVTSKITGIWVRAIRAF